jgi:hypothetical protein
MYELSQDSFLLNVLMSSIKRTNTLKVALFKINNEEEGILFLEHGKF